MRRPKKAQLYAMIRLVPDVDSIGVPIFSSASTNAMFVPEMDTDFSIARFQEFFNEDGYHIEYRLPQAVHGKWYRIGEPAPLTFWYKGDCRSVEGDATPDTFRQIFGTDTNTHPVLTDIVRLLDDARSGRLRRLKARWVAEDLSTRFHDVFYETPIRSKYWVSRYRTAIATARKNTQPPHPIDIRLRRVGREWMKRFATKTDLARLQAILGKAEDGIFGHREATSILYAFLVNKVATNALSEIDREIDKDWFKSIFPFGLQGYSTSRDWKGVTFEFNNPRDFSELLVQEVVNCRSKRNFKSAERLAFLLYGRMNLPPRVLDFINPIYLEKIDKFNDLLVDVRVMIADRARADEWGGVARQALTAYETLMEIDGMINGIHRLSREIVNHRFGVTSYFIGELKNLANLN